VKDLYSVLGIDRTAAQDEIKRAYRKLAMRHHPDRGGDPEYFQQIQQAYDTLSDPQQRAQYDQPQGFYTHKHSFDDILDQYFTQFDMRSQMRNSRIRLIVDLADAVKGGARLVDVTVHNKNIAVEIEIPPGIQNGETVRYPRLIPGGQDLVVQFHIRPDENWSIEERDLHTHAQLDFWQLITGTAITITDLRDNTYKIQIPPKTRPGAKFKLSGKGIHRSGFAPGDIYVIIKAVLPDSIPQSIVDILHNLDTNK